MKNLGREKHYVQNPLINYVSEASSEYLTFDGRKIFLNLGWEYVSPREAFNLRGGRTNFIFKEIFIDQIQKLNPDFMNPSLAEEIIKKLEIIPANIEGNFIAWKYLKGLKTIFVPDEKRERNIKFIDTENIERNKFQVTKEFEFTNGHNTIRPDIVFLINGIPILLVETKASNKVNGMEEAFKEIKRYHLEGPELLAIIQVYALTHIIKYYYSATWNISESLLFNWEEEVKGNFEILVKTFFNRKRIVKLITDFILFTRKDDELKKIAFRPHQMRAVDKLIERAECKEKKRGLVWHTQGSGKTYTMIVTAQKIIENPIFENPTVIMLVDRNELEAQLFGNLTAVGIEQVEVAHSKKDLEKLLSTDTRGLIISMIHKFEDISQNINTRENIFVLVDEAHRTTGGKLGNYLMGALPKATYIGFTGTPIDKTVYGEGTFIVFGKDDPPQGYLDKYSIRESIEDGTTVPLHYALAPNELWVDKEILEKEFLNLAETQGISDIENLNKVLEKAVTLKNMLKNKERVEKVAKYVADHYKENVEPLGYKAFLVAVDREACTFYKEELDKYLPSNYSEVIFSANYNDLPELKKFHLSKDEEKVIRKAFKKLSELPKILIVTEKLLTGFDAPILYCMYLDKPMRDHVLLQAIARVNRPYEGVTNKKKTSGFILDFVGIFDNLEKALAFDSQDIEGVVQDIEILKKRFSQLVNKAREKYLILIEDKTQDKAVEAVLLHFMDEEKRQEYYKFFKEISDIYDIISPDDFLRPYIEIIETLAKMYRILKEAYEPRISVDSEFSKKTIELVQKHTKTSKIKSALDLYKINEETLRKIEESKVTDTEKVFNLLKSIEKDIEREIFVSPYLISIGEKAELIAGSFRERQKNTQETLEELKRLIKEINTAKKEQEEKNMPSEVFSVFWFLKRKGVSDPEDKANEIGEVFKKFPYWKTSEHHEREIKQKLCGILLRSEMKDKDVFEINKIVQETIRVIKGGAG